MNENVLVVPTTGIAPMLQGSFTTANLQSCLDYILANQSFLSRHLAETDESFKQIIPYVVVRHEGRYLLARRTNRQSETRLHGKSSVGIGGHINDAERFEPGTNIIEAGLERELEEEIHLCGNRRSLQLAGIISDNNTAVGRVHLGLVFILETDSADFRVNEPELMTAEWAEIQTLRERYSTMETWSQIVFDNIIARVA